MFKAFLNVHISLKISMKTSGLYSTPSENTDKTQADY